VDASQWHLLTAKEQRAALGTKARKRPSAKQVAARKRFARAAKRGKIRKGSKL